MTHRPPHGFCLRIGLCLGVLFVAESFAGCGCGTSSMELLDGAPADGASMDGSGGGDGSPVDGSGSGDGSPGDGSSGPCVPQSCEGHVTECADCMDNDGDGLADAVDPECLGPCDNTEEAGLLPGVGGDTSVICTRDCYFDFGDGSGNDDCYWDHRCDPYETAPSFWPQGSMCTYDATRLGGRDCPDPQSATCHAVCAPLTPNGCDCFGCCTFDALHGRADAAGGEFVYLGSVIAHNSSCTLADIMDTSLCQPCHPVGDCFNDCGHCELCVGRSTLPADCMPPPPLPDGGVPPPVDGGVEYRCPPGVQPCGLPGDSACPAGTAPPYYCVTGCCVAFG